MEPTPEEATAEFSEAQLGEPTQIVKGQWPRFVAGGPDEVRATVEQMIEESGADELMVQDLIADLVARCHSHEILAQMFGPTPDN